MSYDPPTNDDFLAAFPEFTDTAPATVTRALTRGGRNVDTDWIEADYKEGIMLYAAHMLTLAENAADSGGATGEIASESLGRISVSYREGSDTADPNGLGATTYGSQYYTLLKQNRGGPRVI